MKNPTRYGWNLVPAAVLLLLFAAMATTGMRGQSATFDEPLHLAAGYSYWTQNEYRLSSENGNLAQRWAAIPLLFGDYRLPTEIRGGFQTGYDFFYGSGNDARAILMRGRAMIVLLGVFLGVAVYLWSAQLFGAAGGLLSLTLYCFSPALLAHAQVATSDLAVALFFTLAVWSIWTLLQRVAPGAFIAVALAVAGLLTAKMSGLLILPIALILIGIRLVATQPLVIALPTPRTITARSRRALVFALLLVLQIAVVTVIVSGFYGFRFDARNPPAVVAEAPVTAESEASPEAVAGPLAPAAETVEPQAPTEEIEVPTEEVQAPSATKLEPKAPRPGRMPPAFHHLLEFARRHRLFPEAYLHGLEVVARHALTRPAFFNGRYGNGGWFWFFPYCLLVKTPLPLFLLLVLAVAATVTHWFALRRTRGLPLRSAAATSLYRTAPLWVLLIAYWATAVAVGPNIGERHLLPVYPATFILAGAAAFLLRRRYRLPAIIVTVALALFVFESLRIRPHYLAYFNQLVGGPANGYRHLVDSNLDWGQDLPGLARWLRANHLDRQRETPVYLSYFGSDNPAFYGIEAERLPGYLDLDVSRRGITRLKGGVYCISATMLQMVPTFPQGRWSHAYEQRYQPLVPTAYLAVADRGSEGAVSPRGRFIPDDIKAELSLFPYLQLGRLCAYLRARTPDAWVGYSILIYRLSDEDVRRALFTPPAELEADDAVVAGMRPRR